MREARRKGIAGNNFMDYLLSRDSNHLSVAGSQQS